MQVGLLQTREPTSSNKKLVLVALFGMMAIVGLFLCMQERKTVDLKLLQSNNVESFILSAFQKWATKFNKVYLTEQDAAFRLRVFRDNFFEIKTFTDQGKKFTVGLNKFADLTKDEFKSMYLNSRIDTTSNRVKNVVYLDTSNLPDRVDWREKGAITPVKDQGMCGSCWAFSATGSLESVLFNKKKKLVSYSEQQLVDCSTDFGNYGCNGGLMSNSFQYIIAGNPLSTEQQYPYEGYDNDCRDKKKGDGSIDSYVDIAENDNDQLAAAVAAHAVSVAVEADMPCFQFYESGTIDDPSCGTQLNHGVTAVGYDTTADPPFWIVKNSWGTGWGNEGYLQIKKDTGSDPGICGIGMMNSYPVKE